MGMIKLTSEGSWWLSSKSDKRWNCSGRTHACGGFVMPHECKQKIEDIKKSLGDPPEDLEYGYMKD